MDDGSPESCEDDAHIQRFRRQFIGNGELAVWDSESGVCLGHCDPFIPVNIDLGRTAENFREAERENLEEAARRRKVLDGQE